jgi:hypothetical protein
MTPTLAPEKRTEWTKLHAFRKRAGRRDMGGEGSGRWRSHQKRSVVESCLVLDIRQLAREGWLDRETSSGLMWWAGGLTQERIGSLRFRRDSDGSQDVIRLLYTITRRNGARMEIDEPVPVRATVRHTGGRQWWFVCPLSVDGRGCGRRVCKLYLPPSSRYFGCRYCHDLTYRSCQLSHSRWLRSPRLFGRDFWAPNLRIEPDTSVSD